MLEVTLFITEWLTFKNLLILTGIYNFQWDGEIFILKLPLINYINLMIIKYYTYEFIYQLPPLIS